MYYSKGDCLKFSVYDKDEGIRQALLGKYEMSFDEYYPSGFEGNVKMKSLGGGKNPTLQIKVKVLGAPDSGALMGDDEKVVEERPEVEREKTVQFFPPPLHLRPDYVPGQGLAVTVLCANRLCNRDTDGKSDPFVTVEIRNREDSSFKTAVVKANLNPVWNHTGQLQHYVPGDAISFVVWDKDEGRVMGDMLGKAELKFDEYCNGCEGGLKLPAGGFREPALLVVRVEVLGPPDPPDKKAKRKVEAKVDQRARETKHIFLEFLRHRRGSTFRGWRLDIDRRCTNRVSYTDLMASCKCVGLSLDEARRVWRAYRPLQTGDPANPLEYHEFDTEEWDNLSSFLSVLWEELNFDLDLAWSIMDPMQKGWVTFEEFAAGMDRISFDGDVRLIFTGLDTGGQGRLWRHELDCLKLLPPESHSHRESSPMVIEFKEWVLEKYGAAPEALLFDLGFKPSKDSTTTVRCLAEGIQRLGYKGDALHTCMAIARCNTSVTAHDLGDLLGKRSGPRQSMSYAGRKWAFRPAERQKRTHDNAMQKPSWNGSIYDPMPLNSRLGVRERHYFAIPFDRPIRDTMFKELEMNKGFKVRQANERGETVSKEDRRARGLDSGGLQPMRDEDLQRVCRVVTQSKVASDMDPDMEKAQADAATKIQALARGRQERRRFKLKEPRALQGGAGGKGGELQDFSALAKTSPMGANSTTNSSTGVFRIRVSLLGGRGLLDEDRPNAVDPYCTCEIAGVPGAAFTKTVQRETIKGKTENFTNLGVLDGCALDSILDFGVFEKDSTENDDDTCIGLASIHAEQILPDGFEGALQLTDDEDVAIEGSDLLVKIEILT
jgi:hypothetical protein